MYLQSHSQRPSYIIVVPFVINRPGIAGAVLQTPSLAFLRQNPKLVVDAFVACRVRPALIPLLLNYFQNNRLRVKWKGIYSNIRKLNCGGPQGSLFGILAYLAQRNYNANTFVGISPPNPLASG